jgi:hypothetical protein
VITDRSSKFCYLARLDTCRGGYSAPVQPSNDDIKIWAKEVRVGDVLLDVKPYPVTVRHVRQIDGNRIRGYATGRPNFTGMWMTDQGAELNAVRLPSEPGKRNSVRLSL